MEAKLSAYQCWKKKEAENLNDEQFKKLLIDNGIIVKKKRNMKTDFRLVGLSKPRSATMEFLDTDKTTFWGVVEMSKEKFQELWNYCKDNWKDKKIAEVEHDGFYEDGTPKNAKVVAVREWDL